MFRNHTGSGGTASNEAMINISGCIRKLLSGIFRMHLILDIDLMNVFTMFQFALFLNRVELLSWSACNSENETRTRVMNWL